MTNETYILIILASSVPKYDQVVAIANNPRDSIVADTNPDLTSFQMFVMYWPGTMWPVPRPRVVLLPAWRPRFPEQLLLQKKLSDIIQPERADIVGIKLAISAYFTITSLRASMIIPPASSRASVVNRAGSLVRASLTELTL